MAFKLEKNLVEPNFEKVLYLPSTASESYKIGEVLTESSGALTKGGADSDGTQKYICCEDYTAPASGNRAIAVYKIEPTMIFRVPCQASNAGTTLFTKVTIHTDGLQVTATATKGVAKIIDKLGSGATEVLVMFE